MPGTITSAVLRLVQKKYNVPIINVAYDGQGQTNIDTRLEAFMYQVREHFANSRQWIDRDRVRSSNKGLR
jgi:hypothetical protein